MKTDIKSFYWHITTNVWTNILHPHPHLYSRLFVSNTAASGPPLSTCSGVNIFKPAVCTCSCPLRPLYSTCAPPWSLQWCWSWPLLQGVNTMILLVSCHAVCPMLCVRFKPASYRLTLMKHCNNVVWSSGWNNLKRWESLCVYCCIFNVKDFLLSVNCASAFIASISLISFLLWPIGSNMNTIISIRSFSSAHPGPGIPDVSLLGDPEAFPGRKR